MEGGIERDTLSKGENKIGRMDRRDMRDTD